MSDKEFRPSILLKDKIHMRIGHKQNSRILLC